MDPNKKREFESKVLHSLDSINKVLPGIQTIPIMHRDIKQMNERIDELFKTIYRGNGQKAVVTSIESHANELVHHHHRLTDHQEQIHHLRDGIIDRRDKHTDIRNSAVDFSNKKNLIYLSTFLTLFTGIAVKLKWWDAFLKLFGN